MYSTFLGMQLNCIKKNTKVLNISFSDIFLSKMGVKVAEIKLIFVLPIKGSSAQYRANQNKSI